MALTRALHQPGRTVAMVGHEPEIAAVLGVIPASKVARRDPIDTPRYE